MCERYEKYKTYRRDRYDTSRMEPKLHEFGSAGDRACRDEDELSMRRLIRRMSMRGDDVFIIIITILKKLSGEEKIETSVLSCCSICCWVFVKCDEEASVWFVDEGFRGICLTASFIMSVREQSINLEFLLLL